MEIFKEWDTIYYKISCQVKGQVKCLPFALKIFITIFLSLAILNFVERCIFVVNQLQFLRLLTTIICQESFSLQVQVNETCRNPGQVHQCSKTERQKEGCHQQRRISDAFESVLTSVLMPWSLSSFNCGCIVQTYPVISVSKSVRLNESMRPAVSLSLCSLFACLLFPPDEMRNVS